MKLIVRLISIAFLILSLPVRVTAARADTLSAPISGDSYPEKDLNWDAAFALPGLDAISADSGANFPYQGNAGSVFALVAAPDGSVYAGGTFTLASGQPARNVARWDGTRWLPLGDGLPWTVKALAYDSASHLLYAGGVSVIENSKNVSHLACWNGAAWTTLASFTGWEAFGGPEVDALALDGSGNLYLGGTFAQIDNQNFRSIARWSSTSGWTALGSGAPTYGGSVYSLWADAAGNLYAGGRFTSMGGGDYTSGLAYWDRSAWHGLFIGVGTVNQLGVGANGILYTLGAQGVNLWNGAADFANNHWTALNFPSPDPYQPSALWVGVDGTVLAAGKVAQNGANLTTVMSWAGNHWTPLGAAADSDGVINTMARTSNRVLYAGGFFASFGGAAADNIIRFDGSHWYAVGEGRAQYPALPYEGTFDKITYGPDGALYADLAYGYDHRVLRFDGASWTQLGPAFSSIQDYGGVTGLIMDHFNNLYVAGQFTQIGGVTVNNIARWDGSQWQPLSGGLTAASGDWRTPKVNALAMDDARKLYVAGLFTSVDGLPVDGFAIWDGVGWGKPYNYGGHLACSKNCAFTALAWDRVNYQMYLGGVFYVDGSWRQVGIWSPFDGYSGIAGEPYSAIVSLALDGSGSLYAGATGGLEKWNGSNWSTPVPITPLAYAGVIPINLRTDPQGRVIVAGSFYNACGASLFDIFLMDSGGCTAYGSGLSGPVTDLALDPQGRLTASGYFNGAGSRRVEGLAHWSGEALPARLSLNFQDARPGSAINVGGMYFNPGGQASVWLNGQLLSTGVAVDAAGMLTFQLTSTQAAAGQYGLTVVQTSSNGPGAASPVDAASLPSASASFRLDAAYPLFTPEGSPMTLPIPQGIGFTRGLFLPEMRRSPGG